MGCGRLVGADLLHFYPLRGPLKGGVRLGLQAGQLGGARRQAVVRRGEILWAAPPFCRSCPVAFILKRMPTSGP
jgi:hypothetical protein